MSATLAKGIRVGLIVLLWMPLIVTENQTIFPHAVGKAIFARSLIEVLAATWVVLVIVDPTYRPRRSLVILTFGAYVLVSLFAAVFGVSFTKSIWSEYGRMLGVWDLFHWFLFVLIATSVVRTAQQWRFLLNWLLVVALLLSVIALGQAYGFPLPFLPPAVDRSVDRVDATLGNASFLAAILAVTTLLALGFLSRSLLKPDPGEEEAPAPAMRGRGRRLTRREEERRLGDHLRHERMLRHLRHLFWVAVIVLGVWALFLTGTRGALVGLIAGLFTVPVALGVWGNRRMAVRLGAPVVGVLLSMIVLAVIVEVADFRLGPGATTSDVFSRLVDTSRRDGSLGPRLASGRIALQSFADRPILGWGPEIFPRRSIGTPMPSSSR